jgi:hypothetical protein
LFNIGLQGGLSRLCTFIIADLPISFVITLLHQNCSPESSYHQQYTLNLGWKFEYLICHEDWLSSAMHMQVLTQGVLHDSSVNSHFSPAWP